MRYLFFLLIIGSISCSTTKSDTTTDNQNKELFFSGDFNIKNASFDEDIHVLTKSNIESLKQIMKNDLVEALKSYKYVVSDKSKGTRLDILKTDLKEFKIHVEGPSLNVLTFRVDYQLTDNNGTQKYFEEVNKESLEPFETSIIQDISNELINKIVKRIVQK